MTQDAKTYAFAGGLDSNSPALGKPPGTVIGGDWYEPLAEGYARMQGYERFDGRLPPSAATHWTIDFGAGLVEPAVGNVITGGTSGATAVLLAAPIINSGTWDADNAAGTFILGMLTGTFLSGEPLNVGVTTIATATGTAIEDDADDAATYKTWRSLAQEYARSLIQRVPGSGPVRGVAVHNNVVYAWRDNADATALVGYKATAAGWVALPLLLRINFSLGTSEIFEGDTVTGASSGATGTARRVVSTSGDWTAGTAAGFIDVTPLTGTFSAGEVLKVAGTNRATGDTKANVTLPPGGRVRWIIHNFYGASNLERIYAATSNGPGFEMLEDGAISTIRTGMADDKPQRVFQIANHLGFTFAGGSIQFSGTGEPHLWQVVLGAGEIGFGSEVTDVVEANQTAVAIFGLSKIGVLQGTDKSTFALDILTKQEAGALPDTAQRVVRTMYLDARGLRSLDATQAFGNFKTGSLSGQFERYLNLKRQSGAIPVGTFVCKSKTHYRLVWNDGTGISVLMGGKNAVALPFAFPDGVRPYCFGTGETLDGEQLFFGGEDGFVYQLDSGNTLDGQQMTSYLAMAYNHFGNPIQQERFHKIAIEMEAPAECSIGIVADFDYAEGTSPNSGIVYDTSHGGGGFWDVSAYNDFYWSSPVSGRLECPIDGFGRNANFTIISQPLPTEEPHILQAYQVFRTPRRAKL